MNQIYARTLTCRPPSLGVRSLVMALMLSLTVMSRAQGPDWTPYPAHFYQAAFSVQLQSQLSCGLQGAWTSYSGIANFGYFSLPFSLEAGYLAPGPVINCGGYIDFYASLPTSWVANPIGLPPAVKIKHSGFANWSGGYAVRNITIGQSEICSPYMPLQSFSFGVRHNGWGLVCPGSGCIPPGIPAAGFGPAEIQFTLHPDPGYRFCLFVGAPGTLLPSSQWTVPGQSQTSVPGHFWIGLYAPCSTPPLSPDGIGAALTPSSGMPPSEYLVGLHPSSKTWLGLWAERGEVLNESGRESSCVLQVPISAESYYAVLRSIRLEFDAVGNMGWYGKTDSVYTLYSQNCVPWALGKAAIAGIAINPTCLVPSHPEYWPPIVAGGVSSCIEPPGALWHCNEVEGLSSSTTNVIDDHFEYSPQLLANLSIDEPVGLSFRKSLQFDVAPVETIAAQVFRIVLTGEQQESSILSIEIDGDVKLLMVSSPFDIPVPVEGLNVLASCLTEGRLIHRKFDLVYGGANLPSIVEIDTTTDLDRVDSYASRRIGLGPRFVSSVEILPNTTMSSTALELAVSPPTLGGEVIWVASLSPSAAPASGALVVSAMPPASMAFIGIDVLLPDQAVALAPLVFSALNPSASVSAFVPNDPILDGMHLYCQALAWDFGVPFVAVSSAYGMYWH